MGILLLQVSLTFEINVIPSILPGNCQSTISKSGGEIKTDSKALLAFEKNSKSTFNSKQISLISSCLLTQSSNNMIFLFFSKSASTSSK